MAHEITKTDSMMYAGEVPWHGLGTYVGDEEVDSATALRMSGLDWRVGKRPIVAVASRALSEADSVSIDDDGAIASNLGSTAVQASVDYNVILREDTGSILGCVGNQYTPMQNTDAFAFLDGIIGRGAHYHTAGSLKGGRLVWLLAKTDKLITVGGKDRIEPYLLLFNGHDGRSSLRCTMTSVRVVCNNTLQLALNGAKESGVSLRHTNTIHARVAEAQRILGLAEKSIGRFQNFADELLERTLRAIEWEVMLELLVPTAPADKLGTKAENDRNDLNELFRAGKTPGGLIMPGGTADMANTAGTAWGALNAVTAWTGNWKTVQGDATEARTASKWQGSAGKFDAAAVALLEEVLMGHTDKLIGRAATQLINNGHRARAMALV